MRPGPSAGRRGSRGRGEPRLSVLGAVRDADAARELVIELS